MAESKTLPNNRSDSLITPHQTIPSSSLSVDYIFQAQMALSQVKIGIKFLTLFQTVDAMDEQVPNAY